MPTILEELLPKTWVTGISSAIAIVAIADSVRRILSGGPGSILGKDNVRRLRIFAGALTALLVLQWVYTNPTPTSGAVGPRPLSFWPAVVVGTLYLLSESALGFWRWSFRRRRTLLPINYLRTAADTLRGRQTSTGAFRVKGGGEDARAEDWSTAQVVHALVSAVNTVDMAGVVERAIQFYRVELAKPTSLWSGAKNALITPSSWILLSLAEFARSAHWSNLKDDEKKEVRAWIKQGVTILLGLQTTEGGWTPLGSKKQLDLRTLPTVTVLWSLAAVLRARSAVELSEDETKACVTAVGRGWDFLMESSTELAGDRWWDPNPHRGWRQKCVGLTLLTYGVLFVVSEALSEVTRGNDTARPGTDRLQQWLKNQHNAIMRQLDHCLHRDLEDMEADGPWDHIVSDQDGTSREIPITYFDWPTSALFALRLSKSAKCYDYSDAAREQVLSNLLANAAKSQEHAYSFRLAMILIASAVDGPILGMT